jgi:CxxC-x17-CxxC domain-containing protein
MSDKTITCRDCGQTFSFSEGEQEYYQQRGFSEPMRCPSCRSARKTQREGGSSFGSGRTGGDRQMYAAVCAQCGKQTEVPFQPRGDKPVYCNDCFSSRGGGSRSSGGYGGGGGGGGRSRSGGGGGGRDRW